MGIDGQCVLRRLQHGACALHLSTAQGLLGFVFEVQTQSGQPELGLDVNFVDRLDVGVFGGDDAFYSLSCQFVAEGLHALFTSGLHERRDHVGLGFTDQGGNGSVDNQYLEGRDTSALDLFAERLRDHALERVGQHRTNLILTPLRKLVDHALNGGCRVVGVERGEDQVTGLSRLDGDFHGFQIAHFAN